MTRRKLLENAAPKPRAKRKPPKTYSSIKHPSYAEAKKAFARLQSRATPLPRTRKKKTERKDPNRIYGPQHFRDFLHAHACLGCGYRGEAIEQSHVHSGGQGRKDDYQRTVPLCGRRMAKIVGFEVSVTGCHHDYDHAKQSWPASKGIDIELVQDAFWSEYENHCERIGKRP